MKLIEKIKRLLNPYHGKVAEECTDPEFLKLLDEGEEIKAIKRYRQLVGIGLKEAYDYVHMELEKRRHS